MGTRRWTEEMCADVKASKERGETYRSLGERYNVTPVRVRTVHMKYLRILRRRNENI